MLTKSMRKYVLSKDKAGFDLDTQRMYNSRLRRYVKSAIEDLSLVAKNLPEKELQELFNAKTMSTLFRDIFEIEIADMEEKYSKKIKAKRQRLFSLSKSLLNIFDNGQFVSSILPITTKVGKSAKYLKTLYDYETDAPIT
jgi:hypothetical protein